MEQKAIKNITKHIIIGIILCLSGTGGLFYLFINTLPTLGPRWLFFFFLMIAVSGLALPVIAFLHKRFPSNPPAGDSVVIRQSIWVGIFVNGLAWLQLGRLLSYMFAVFLAVGLVLIEFLIRIREQSRWEPEAENEE